MRTCSSSSAGDRAVEDGVVGDDLLGGIAAGLGRTVERLVDASRRAANFVFSVSMAADGGAVVEVAGQGLADLVHPVARAVGLLAVLVELGAQFRFDHGRPDRRLVAKPRSGLR